MAIVDAHPRAARARSTRIGRGRRGPVSQAQAPRGDRRPAARGGHPVHRRRRADPVRHARRSGTSSRRCARSRIPQDDVALTRMMTAGPWRLDALEILRVLAHGEFDRRQLDGRDHDRRSRPARRRRRPDAEDPRPGRSVDAADPARQAAQAPRRDRRAPAETWREGPFTILERYLERTARSWTWSPRIRTDAHRTVTNIASFLRFAADWQAAHPKGRWRGSSTTSTRTRRPAASCRRAWS